MLARYGVLWYWEAYINSLLENLTFEKVILIKKNPYCYIGYFTVNDPDLYGQIVVKFGKKSVKTSLPLIYEKKKVLLMKYTYEGDVLIFDKRHEFDWIVGKN
jgi:hypothetical protein